MEEVGLDGVAFGLEGGADATQGCFTGVGEVDIVALEHDGRILALIVELVGTALGSRMETVANGDRTATDRHAVDNTGLLVVIIAILFIRRYHELVLAIVHEDRITQGIYGFAVLLGIERQVVCHTIHVGIFARLLSISGFLHTIEELGHLDLDRRTIDAVVNGVIGDRAVVVGIVDMIQRRIRQIEGLAARTCGEESGIAVGSSLHHFVLHREEVRRILTRRDIRTEDDAFLLEEDVRTVDGAVQRIMRQVVGIVDDMGGVIAFEHEYELEVITEVILTQAEAVLECLLVITTGYTSDETYLRLVIQPNAVQRFDEREGRIALRDKEPSVVLKRMSGFGYLQTAGHGLGNNQFEIAVRSCAIDDIAPADGIAVENEIGISYRDGREVVEHTTGEPDGAGIDEMDRRRDGMTRIQRHGRYAGGGVVITEGTVLRGRCDGIDRTRCEVISQTIKQIRTGGIRREGGQSLSIRGEDDLYACHSGVIRHLDHTGYLSEGRTPAFGGLVIRRSIAITGIVRRDGIFVVLIGHGGLVEEIVILSGIDDLGSLGRTFDHTLDHKRIDCRRVDGPLKLYTGFELIVGVALRSREGRHLCRFRDVELRSVDGYRPQIDRIRETEGGIGRVD